MINEKISVIVSAYKAEKEIDICVRSILDQTYENIELIIVDNASPDKIPQIVDWYMAEDKRVVALHNKKNIGVGDGRNTGLEWVMNNSDSSYVFFVDADDWIHPECLSRLFSMIKNDGSDIAFTKHIISSKYTESKRINESDYTTHYYDDMEDFWINIVEHIAFCTGRLFKKQLFSEIRFPESGLDDERTTYRLVFASQRVSTMNIGLYHWYQNPNSFMHKRLSVTKIMDIISSTREPLDYYYKYNYPISFKSQKDYYIQILCVRMFNSGWKKRYRKGYLEEFIFIKSFNELYPKMNTSISLDEIEKRLIQRFSRESEKTFKRARYKKHFSSLFIFLRINKNLYKLKRLLSVTRKHLE